MLPLYNFAGFNTYQINEVKESDALVMNRKNEDFTEEDEKIWDPLLKSPKKSETINKKRALKPS